ncbi:hypothetical protein ONS95_004230 [Cadophora gregata]|uniref:uncharacterized protein n=1 Tax=Cadophora gregata TaxID=51156 RepID=UPI0026DBAC95|nr:uncharacterized protein ONS95_004230 [Cadophora gregata]KAK0105705.1 hypothetical protein ONS95_004230 [Cadophora gregata]
MAIILALSLFLCLFSTVNARSLAQPAVQHLSSRAEYQGGWPLALIGTASPSCPASASESCSSTAQNPACCPSGQTCTWSGSVYASYCCPTSADCQTAVLNFPRCSNSIWTMFIQYPSGFFCCEPGMLGVNPSSGKSGGLCEPADQHVPASLLATVMAQVGTLTPLPTPTTGGNRTATATGGGGSGATQTNPSLAPTSTGSGSGTSHSLGSFSNWSLGIKVGIGAAIVVAILLLAMVGCRIRRRRREVRYASPLLPGERNEMGVLMYNESGLPPAYEPYRRRDGNANNVTVNVVHGDYS